MRKVWTLPWPWVFGAATAFGLSSFLQAYRLTLLNSKPGMTIEAGKLLILNLALWFLPALMMPGSTGCWGVSWSPIPEGRIESVVTSGAAFRGR